MAALVALAATENASDEALYERFVGGDSRALGVLYDRHCRALKAFAIQQGAARPDDVVQDAFVRVVRNAQGFKGQSKFKTWLYTIARNLCVDASRRDKFRSGPSLDAPMGDDDGLTLGERIASDAPGLDASRNTADKQFRQAYEAAMQTLPDEQREVFTLREISGLSFAEIAEATATNENTVKSRMRYALKALREALADFA
ncbi:MAG: sigma-70 family RNA polymerase sigma factor [Deltaproteobacteria bacterium]|nr:sigma-70 family RNA polymerase sigma factor [Deltaproteobacteria bacterium]